MCFCKFFIVANCSWEFWAMICFQGLISLLQERFWDYLPKWYVPCNPKQLKGERWWRVSNKVLQSPPWGFFYIASLLTFLLPDQDRLCSCCQSRPCFFCRVLKDSLSDDTITACTILGNSCSLAAFFLLIL